MRTYLLALVLVLTACGDDNNAPDIDAGSSIDAGNTVDAAGQIDASDFSACSFPMDFGPDDFTFICNADSATDCEVTNRPTTAGDLCTDQGLLHFIFRQESGATGNVVQTTVGKFLSSSAGTFTDKSIINIPGDTVVGASVELNGTNYFLEFKFNTTANTLTISSFSP